MPTVGTVQVKLAVDAREFGPKLADGSRAVQQFASRAEQTANRVTRLSNTFAQTAGNAAGLTGQLGQFSRAAGAAATATQVLSGAAGLAGLATMLTPAGVILAGVATLAVLIAKSGEAARKAKEEIENYGTALKSVPLFKLEEQQAALEAAIARQRATRDALQRAATPATRTDAEALASLTQVPLAEQTKGIDDAAKKLAEANRVVTALEGQLQAVRDAIFYAGLAAKDAGIADRLRDAQKAAEDFGKAIREAAEDLRTLGLLGGLAGRGVGLSATAGQLGGPRTTGTPIIGGGVLPGAGPRIGGLAPGLPFGPAPKIEVPDAVRAMYDTRFAIVQELKNVPGQIASNLAAFLGPIISKLGVGGAIGASIGGALGGGIGAGLSGRIAAGIGGNLGAAIGGAAGPLGMIAGTLLGAAVGSLFGHHKKAVDESAAALRQLARQAERVSEAIFGLPAGIKIALSRYNAITPENPNAPPPATDPEIPTPLPTGPGPTGPGGGPEYRGGRWVFHFSGPITLPGVTNAPEFIREIGRMAEREAARGGVGALSLSLARRVA